MHEKNGAFVVQDTSTGHLNLSCAVLSLDSSVFIFWNRYCTYTAHGFHARLFAVIHALEESVVASFAPQLLAACLLLHVHLMIIFWSHVLTLVRPSCCLFRDAYPQEHAALLLRRARLLSCICTRKMVPLLFRTSQPVMCLSVSGFICVHLLEHTQVLRAFTLFAVMHIHKKHVALFAAQHNWTCLCSISEIHS